MGAWGMTAWANDSALDWVHGVTEKIAAEIEEVIVSGERHEVIAAGDLLNQLTVYTFRKDADGTKHRRWGGTALKIHYKAESRKLYSRMIAQLECLRADEDWTSSWSDGGEGSKAEMTRLINALRRKVRHEPKDSS